LLMMENHWGAIPSKAWDKASGAYGDAVYLAFRKAKELLKNDPQYLNACLEKMGMDDTVASLIKRSLDSMPECEL
ncbi:MAG TPA: hypothetical protein VFW53_07435, partial [Gallionella sp.]|nr:hypothetical protein [Gallionella sp.]